MKKNLLKMLSVLGLGVLCGNIAFAQTDTPAKSPTEREKQIVSAAGDVYVISAKAGGISAVEGKVAVMRENGKSGLLVKGDNLEVGDRVSTGADGRVEILLNPGSYLRLGENAEFEFLTTNLEDLRLRVTRGSAIFEVFASDEFQVQVNTPNNKLYFIETGIYRVDVTGATETVSVWRGKTRVGEYDAKTVKAGKRAIISNGKVSVNKFKRDQLDALGKWSETRAELIAKANEKLQEDALRRSLLDSYRQNGWGFNDSFGLWVYNPYLGAYCFLPFGSRWRSPYGYGYGYGYDFWSYGNHYPWYPNWGNNPPSTGNPQTPPPTTTPTPSGNPPPSAANLERAERLRTPPFQRMPEESRGGDRGGSGSSDSGSSSPTFDSGSTRSTRSESPSYNPPPSSNDSKPSYSPPPSPPSPPVFAPPQSSDTKGKP